MWKIDPKEKCIHKYKHDHIYTYMYVCIYNTFSILGLFGEREEKRMIESE
jgi:hypothetical protein